MQEQIKIYVINLKSSIDRRKYIENLLSKLGLNFEIFDAVIGKDLNEQFIENIYDSEKARKNFGRELSKGEIGCALSHKTLWKKIVEEKIDYALILEDDIMLDSKIHDVIKYFISTHLNWDVVLLSGSNSRRIPIYKNIIGNTSLSYCTGITTILAAYLINNKAANRLLKLTQKIYQPIDIYTGDIYTSNLHILRIDPIFPQNKLFHEFSGSSTLASDRNTKDGFLKKIKYKLHKFLINNIFGSKSLEMYYYVKNNLFLINDLIVYQKRKSDLFGEKNVKK